jgi:hypothetical protein
MRLVALLLACCASAACVRDAKPALPHPGTYSTTVRADQPLPADEGKAPFAGSLGPPLHPVQPRLFENASTTREGSGGPPWGPREDEKPDR